MPAPELFIIAGPPGSGKSRAFPLRELGVAFFNADDRAAELNGASYHEIPLGIRAQVNREFEAFIEGHIDRRESFAFETTLRTPITFAQAKRAKANGFSVNMVYVALDDVQTNLERIAIRSGLGFHSAPAEVLRDIHARSLQNLKQAILECGNSLDQLQVFDNTSIGEPPHLIAKFVGGEVVNLADPVSKWLDDALLDGRIPRR